MSTEIKLSHEQIVELAKQIQNIGHQCRFDESESKTLHRFAQSLENGGWAKWQALLDFGGRLIVVNKAGTIAMVTIVIGGLLSALWMGVVAKIKGP